MMKCIAIEILYYQIWSYSEYNMTSSTLMYITSWQLAFLAVNS